MEILIKETAKAFSHQEQKALHLFVSSILQSAAG
jgi:hypothetical protein